MDYVFNFIDNKCMGSFYLKAESRENLWVMSP